MQIADCLLPIFLAFTDKPRSTKNMIIQLFIFGLLFTAFGVYNFIKKKKVLGWMFVLLGVFATVIGLIVVSLYPQTLPDWF